MDRGFFARTIGVPEHRVRVIMRDVGGGFGQKIFRGREETAAVLASRRLGRPVKWIEDRYENLVSANHARDEQMTLKVGVDGEGQIQAIRADYLCDVGAYPFLPPAVPGAAALGILPGPYRIAHYGWSGRSVFTNTSGQGAYRGPWMMETVAREIMMDVVAREIGMDPVELRRRNILHASDLPYTTAGGQQYERLTPAETFEAAVRLIGYDAFREEQQLLREQGRYLGIGVCTYVEPTAGVQGGPGDVEVATVRIEPSGKVNVLMGTGSHGHSLETTMVQIVADQLGVPIDDVRLHQGDTAIAPFGGGTAGSRSAVIGGAVARVSAGRVREKVLLIAAHLLEASPEDLEIADAVISVMGSPGPSVTVAEVAQAAYLRARDLPEGIDPGLEDTSRYIPPATTFANSTQICTCEVDVDTGLITILDWVVGGDYGVVINPMVVEGQVAGGVVQGIGGVLLEHMAYGEDGNPLAVTFKDYLLPTAANVPDIRYVHLETPSGNPGGHKGVGEGGAIGAPAALVNAVSDALAPLGVLLTDQPLSPDRILAAIRAAS
jgi:aerobic carbon-monoxide dehydrogenase large subunit